MTAAATPFRARLRARPARALGLIACALALASCGRGAPPAAETRPQDARAFKAVTPTLAPVPGAALYQGVYAGLQGEAAYQIEVPDNWNGTLVMYAHGYAGTGENLTVAPPPIRAALLAQGYAWGASSYSANYYDVQAGVEDTNALALAFERLTANKHAKPTKYLIMGVSMGGHIAGAAVEKETQANARSKVTYAAALPLCGVMDEEYEFQWLGDYTTVAAQLAGLGARSYPQADYQELLPAIKAALFTDTTTSQTDPLWQENSGNGAVLREIARQLTGGDRPVFELGFRVGGLQSAVFSTGGSDGTVNGILTKNFYGNVGRTYRWTAGATPTAAEVAFNAAILRVAADPQANRARAGGLRWIPRVNGEFSVPVLTLHTLGDFYVPFRHQQLYRQAAQANGNDARLVQRAIRAPGHCDFTPAEIVEGFNDLVAWEKTGVKPAGDDVLTPGAVADPAYGCRFTRGVRPGVAACPPAS
ncbi:alpha/beta hydrolase [Deinococcus budaensis]|uniref:Dienelactone hydrolase n=1 Tax=Deinococcus budaensis TaxID=1665626 RepID=A0A7W8GG63_9DEIO|nr:alpha/beta hydrolase [Deinococcus budaensis]MBB5235005.1 dienelactone hydrolase [Deinococcus budaensis]